MGKPILVEGATATNPKTGEKIIYRAGKWYPSTQGQSPTVDVKEFQANAAARATLMDQGEKSYTEAVKQGYDPSKFRNQWARSWEGNQLGNWMADVIRDPAAERARAAEMQFVDGALRTTTGANAPEPEVIRADRSYFRQPGETTASEADKAELRRRFRDQAVRVAGPAYIDQAPAGAPPPPSTPPATVRATPAQSRQAQSSLDAYASMLPPNMRGAVMNAVATPTPRDAANQTLRAKSAAAGNVRALSDDELLRRAGLK